jgi:hypothetical protein
MSSVTTGMSASASTTRSIRITTIGTRTKIAHGVSIRLINTRNIVISLKQAKNNKLIIGSGATTIPTQTDVRDVRQRSRSMLMGARVPTSRDINAPTPLGSEAGRTSDSDSFVVD